MQRDRRLPVADLSLLPLRVQGELRFPREGVVPIARGDERGYFLSCPRHHRG
jgi:hypothetical protein